MPIVKFEGELLVRSEGQTRFGGRYDCGRIDVTDGRLDFDHYFNYDPTSPMCHDFSKTDLEHQNLCRKLIKELFESMQIDDLRIQPFHFADTDYQLDCRIIEVINPSLPGISNYGVSETHQSKRDGASR